MIYAVARDVMALQPGSCIDWLRDEHDGLLARIAVLERMLPTEPLA